MHKLNNRMNGMGSDRFVSMILIVIDVQTNQLTMVNAGHMLPVHRGSDGAIQELGEDETGIPLGIMSDFEYESFEVALAAGESLTLYTDGINENCNADEEQYGDERLLQLIGSALGDAQQRGDTVLKSVLEFLGDTPPNDDMCLVTFGRDA